jgi:two-component system sensor histidine kinase SenX3
VHAVPLNDGGALALVEDITERWRIDQVRTDFVANVSHELKTPVGAISVLAETLEGETEDELILRLTGRMVLETQRMSRTIDDLLELSRIELGGEALYTSVDMDAVITEVMERVSSLAAKKKVEIVVEQSTSSTLVTGDFFQLTSAIGNLVENAIKYSDNNSKIEVRLRDGSHSMLDVEVEDHGIGIPADSLDRIFERFYRVDRARSRGTGGTGLGLSIVRHVATNHGGEVNVRSREGEGSVFILSIPRVRATS